MWMLSTVEIAKKVRGGDGSAIEVVDSHLARIADFNRSTNAVTQVLADQARQLAEDIDRRRVAGDPRDPRAVPVPTYLPEADGPTSVAVVADPAGMGVHPDVRQSIEYAAGALSDAGYAVEEVPDVPPMAEAITAYLTMVSAEFSMTWPRLRTLPTDTSAQHMELTMNSQPTSTIEQYLQATATRHSLVRDWLAFLETYPLLLGAGDHRSAARYGSRRRTERRNGGLRAAMLGDQFRRAPFGCRTDASAERDHGRCSDRRPCVSRRYVPLSCRSDRGIGRRSDTRRQRWLRAMSLKEGSR